MPTIEELLYEIAIQLCISNYIKRENLGCYRERAEEKIKENLDLRRNEVDK